MLIDCPVCEATVDATDHGTYNVSNDNGVWDYHLAECPRCHSPLLGVVEIYGFEQESEPVRVYPAPSRDLDARVPPAISTAFEEGERCFMAHAYTATALMCRKTIEGLCDDQEVKTKNLDQSIKKLKTEGIIDERLYEWSDALRLTGNAAAHGVRSSLKRQDAQDVLDFTHAIVDYVYVSRHQFRDFKSRHP
jgi:hypothetical protein